MNIWRLITHLNLMKSVESSEKSDEIREIKEAFLISRVGERAIDNENIGQRSRVNRNRGRDLDPLWKLVIEKIPLPKSCRCQEVQFLRNTDC